MHGFGGFSGGNWSMRFVSFFLLPFFFLFIDGFRNFDRRSCVGFLDVDFIFNWWAKYLYFASFSVDSWCIRCVTCILRLTTFYGWISISDISIDRKIFLPVNLIHLYWLFNCVQIYFYPFYYFIFISICSIILRLTPLLVLYLYMNLYYLRVYQ